MRHFYTLVVCVLSSFSFAGDGAGKPSVATSRQPVHLVGRLRVISSKTEDLTTFILGWKTAKSVLTTGRLTLVLSVQIPVLTGTAFSRIPISVGCIWV